jgi:hypothetical protein
LCKMDYGISEISKDHPINQELYLYKYNNKCKNRSNLVCSPAEHLRRAAKLLFKDRIRFDPWTAEHTEIWCRHNFVTIWGPAAASKTFTYGMCVLLDWMSAPSETTTYVFSSSKEGVDARIWGSIKELFSMIPESFPARLIKDKIMCLAGDPDDSTVYRNKYCPRAGIYPRAIPRGAVAKGRDELQGTHMSYVRMILDEMEAVRRAAVDVITNLNKGGSVKQSVDFKFVGLGNPTSWMNMMGEFSMPEDGNYSNITPNTHKWKTKLGYTYHFNGLKSPAIVEKDGMFKYPYLINQKQIDSDLKMNGGNKEDPRFWQYIMGFPPPFGLSNTLFTEQSLARFGAQDAAYWASTQKIIAGLDPAFSANGDRCVLTVAKVGTFSTRVVGVEVVGQFDIPILASDEWVVYAIVERIRQYGEKYGFGPDDMAVDDSGVQSVADTIEKEWGRGVYRVQFGGRASSNPVSFFNNKPSNEEYANRATELAYLVYEFAKYGQLKGLPLPVRKELVQRIVERQGALKRVQSKTVMKDERGFSPDLSDSLAVCLAFVRERMGVSPGQSMDRMGNEYNYSLDDIRNWEYNTENEEYTCDFDID